jgi:ankyrin repeat protein
MDSSSNSPIRLSASTATNAGTVDSNDDDINNNSNNLLSVMADSNWAGVESILRQLPINPNARDKSGRTALHIACELGNLTVAGLLLKKGADIEARYNFGRTALHVAGEAGREGVLDFLIKNGANIEAKDNVGRTVLQRVCYKGYLSLATRLLDAGANSETQDETGSYPLHSACEKGHTHITSLLLDRGTNIINSRDNFGRSGLHLACLYDHLDTVTWLCDRGAAYDSADCDGRTPLHVSSFKDHTEIVAYLVGVGANIEFSSNDGRTPLHCAAAKGHTETIYFLLDKNANTEALVEIAVIGVAFYFYRKAEAYAKNWRIYQPQILYIGVYLATLFYLPCTLALFRLYVCESGSGILSADRHVTCGSAEHIVITVFCSLVHLPVIILTPTALYIWTKELCVYDLSPDHEKRLQMWEILYLMDVTNEYADNCCWAISSFKRKSAYFRCHMLLLKLGLACVFVGCRQNLSVQALLCVILISVFYGYYGLYRKTYRCWISSRMLTVAAVVLIVDTCFGFANSLGIKNFIMVASTESVVLLCVNVVGATALCVLLLLAFGCHRERIKVLLFNCDVMLSQWPAFLTLRNIAESPRLHALCLQWVAALRKANAIQLEVMTASHALLDIDGLETAIRDLRAHWLCASAVGSVFTVALSETLEELLELHTEMRSKALRTVNHWDDSFIVLAETHRFSHRHAHTLLMSDRKKRILTKLLALRTITSGAKINKDKDILRALSFKRRHSSFVVSRNLSPHSSLHSPVHSPNPLVQYLDQANHAMESQQFEELIDWIGELTTKSNTLLTVLQARGGLIGGNIESKPAESDGEVYMLLDDWEALINLFESYSYPRLNAHFSDIDVENWYTFRAALFETLPNVNEGVAEGSYAPEANSNMFSQGSVDELDRLLGLHSGWNKFPFPEEGNDSGIQEV